MKKYTAGFDGDGFSKGASWKGSGFATAPDLNLNYKLVGEWKRANFMMSRFPHLVKMAVNLANREYAKKYQLKVKENILNEGANCKWPAVSMGSRYQKWKQKHAKIQAPMRFFGAMLNNIKVFKHGEMGWAAGIKADVENAEMETLRKGNTLKVAEYAGVLEYGAPHRGIQARPLWNPSYSQIGGNPGLTKEVVKHLRLKFPSTRLKLPTKMGKATSLKSM